MPETFATRCPNCRTAFQVPAAVAGKKIRCKNCQTVFAASADAPKPGTAKPAKPAADTFKVADDGPKPGTAKPVKKAAPPAQPAADDRVKRPFDEDEDTGPDEYIVTK